MTNWQGQDGERKCSEKWDFSPEAVAPATEVAFESTQKVKPKPAIIPLLE